MGRLLDQPAAANLLRAVLGEDSREDLRRCREVVHRGDIRRWHGLAVGGSDNDPADGTRELRMAWSSGAMRVGDAAHLRAV